MALPHVERILAAEREIARRGYSISRGPGNGLYPDFHHHQGLELIWIERGMGQVLVGGDGSVVGSGDVLLVNSVEEHSLRLFSGSWVRGLLYFSPDLVNRPALTCMRALACLPENGWSRARPPAAAQARIHQWVGDMVGESQQDRPGGDAAIAAYLQLILVEMERYLCPPGSESRHAPTTGFSVAREVMSFIENHLADPVTLDDVGRELAMSPRHLERCFREQVGTSVMAFWMERRMEHATKLLRQPDASIGQIAALVGYASPFSFSRAFKRYYGVSPSRAHVSIS